MDGLPDTSQLAKQTLLLQTRFGIAVVSQDSLVRSLLRRHHQVRNVVKIFTEQTVAVSMVRFAFRMWADTASISSFGTREPWILLS